MGIDRDGGAVHTGWSFREGLLEKVGSEQRPEGGATRMCDDGVDAKALGLDGTLVLHVVRVGGAWVREGGGEDRDAMGRACGALWQRGPLRLVLGVRWAPWRA